MKTKILKFGFEIEGEFTHELLSKLRKYGSTHGDSTVHNCDYSHSNFHLENEAHQYLPYEFSSYPFLLNEKNKIKKIFNLLAENNQYHWNKTAGFHIHTSFTPKYPPEILSVQFAQFFFDELTKKIGALKARRKNSYCRDIVNEIEIAELRKEKYRAINFGASLDEHGTIEFRIFPSAKPTRMYKFLLFTIKTINKFLKNDLEIPFDVEIETKKSKLEKNIKIESINNNLTNDNININLKKQTYNLL